MSKGRGQARRSFGVAVRDADAALELAFGGARTAVV
jgi:hypothetical protein